MIKKISPEEVDKIKKMLDEQMLFSFALYDYLRNRCEDRNNKSFS